MLMRQKHWPARLPALNVSAVDDLMGGDMAHPVAGRLRVTKSATAKNLLTLSWMAGRSHMKTSGGRGLIPPPCEVCDELRSRMDG
jgi:hypothetical protein